MIYINEFSVALILIRLNEDKLRQTPVKIVWKNTCFDQY